MIIMQASAKGSALDTAAAYVNEEAGFDTPEKALAGAADIVAETVAEDPENVSGPARLYAKHRRHRSSRPSGPRRKDSLRALLQL